MVEYLKARFLFTMVPMCVLYFPKVNHPNHDFLFLDIFCFHGGGEITCIIPSAHAICWKVIYNVHLNAYRLSL
jgi:hypothetical protein